MSQEYLKAEEDGKNRKMGLNNTICENPAYWCRLHKVWLSKEDTEKKTCLNKLTADMITTYRCHNLVNVEDFPMYERVYQNN